MPVETLQSLNRLITKCSQCPRLVTWRKKIATEKRAAFQNESYWGRPVPAFGDPSARLIIVGLAPAAHGANRTGRMFTGDRSGEWLYSALFRAGFSNQSESLSCKDQLELRDAYITAVVRCAPPENKPTRKERDHCIQHLIRELKLLDSARVILALGKFSWDGVILALTKLGHSIKPKPAFSHGAEFEIGPFLLLGSFHPSQQNTFTGKLTRPMFDDVFTRARKFLKDEHGLENY